MDTLHLDGVKTSNVQHLGPGYLARAEDGQLGLLYTWRYAGIEVTGFEPFRS